MTEKNFIFGYGSLINGNNRKLTGHTGYALPIRVQGVRRSWGLAVVESGMMAVCLTLDQASYCNGMLVEVDLPELIKFDERELIHGYERGRLQNDLIASIGVDEVPTGAFWVYRKKINISSAVMTQYPIFQSYVDVILSGCLDVGLDFAREFILTTTGWETVWVNDRSSPRYPRAMKIVSRQNEIDTLLMEMIPKAFESRKPQQ